MSSDIVNQYFFLIEEKTADDIYYSTKYSPPPVDLELTKGSTELLESRWMSGLNN